MNLGVPVEDIHFATGQPSHHRIPLGLPIDDEIAPEMPAAAYTPSGVRFVPHALRTSAQTTRLGPFCRTAEASILLGEALELMSGSAYTNFINWNQSQSLDGSLQRLAMSLLYQAVNGWEECCGAIGICFRYLLPSIVIKVEAKCCQFPSRSTQKNMGVGQKRRLDGSEQRYPQSHHGH
jgi:hypothetical protein